MEITHHKCGNWSLTVREYARMTKMEVLCIEHLKNYAEKYETLGRIKETLDAAMWASGFKETVAIIVKVSSKYMDGSVGSHSLIVQSKGGFKWVASLRSPFYEPKTVFG